MRNAEWTGRTSSGAAGMWGSTLPCNSAFRIPHSALVLHSTFRIPHSARRRTGGVWPIRRPTGNRDYPPRLHPRRRRRFPRRQPRDRSSRLVPAVRAAARAGRLAQERRLSAATGRIVVQRRGGAGARPRRRAALHRARGLATRGGGRPRPRAAQDSPGFLPGGGRGLEPAGERRPPRRRTERGGVPIPHDLSAAARHRSAGVGPRHDASVHATVEPGVAGPARLVALLAARARYPRIDRRGGGALRPRPAVRLRGLS